jgi:hypothetical protein
MGGWEIYTKFWSGNWRGKITRETPNVKMDLRKVACEGVEWIQLAQVV